MCTYLHVSLMMLVLNREYGHCASEQTRHTDRSVCTYLHVFLTMLTLNRGYAAGQSANSNRKKIYASTTTSE